VVVKGSFSLFSLSYLLNIPEITGFPDLEDLGFFPPVSLTVYLPLLEPNATGSKGQYHRSLLVLEYRVRKGLRCFIFFFLPKEGREGGHNPETAMLVCFLFNELSVHGVPAL